MTFEYSVNKWVQSLSVYEAYSLYGLNLCLNHNTDKNYSAVCKSMYWVVNAYMDIKAAVCLLFTLIYNSWDLGIYPSVLGLLHLYAEQLDEQ